MRRGIRRRPPSRRGADCAAAGHESSVAPRVPEDNRARPPTGDLDVTLTITSNWTTGGRTAQAAIASP